MATLTRIEQRMMNEGIAGFTAADTNALIVAIAGALGKAYYEITPDAILQRHKDLKTDLFSDDCEEAIITGFTSTNGHVYRTNRDDQINMLGQKIEILGDSTIATVLWKTEDVGYISHTTDEWLTNVYKEGFAFKQQTLTKYSTLKGQVAAAAPTNGDYAAAHAVIVALVWDATGSTTTGA